MILMEVRGDDSRHPQLLLSPNVELRMEAKTF